MNIKYPIGGYAPGNYSNKCVSCGDEFTGDKLARQCEPCAINSVNEGFKIVSSELSTLKDALNKIEFSNDVINKLKEL